MHYWRLILLVIWSSPAIGQVNCITTPDQLGPYFVHGAPQITNDTLEPGVSDSSRALELTFYLTYDCDTVDLDTLPSTYSLQLWHANDTGVYSNVDGQPNTYDYRGVLELTGYSTTIHTTLPGVYPNRPSHIHVKGYLTNAWFTDTIITQLYFEGDSLIPFDPASNMSERWIALDTLSNGGFKGSFAFGVSHFVGIDDYETANVQISPNPSDGFLHLKTRFPGTVIIMNNQGQKLTSQRVDFGPSILDFSFLPKGSYVLVVSGEYHRIEIL